MGRMMSQVSGVERSADVPAPALTLSQLWIYPLKGGAGIAVDAWPLDGFGLKYDRRWMVVDESGSFITQRTDASLGRLHQSVTGRELIVRSERAGEIRLPLEAVDTAAAERSRARVWLDDVDVIDCGSDAAAFISTHLERTARIVHMPDDSVRQVDPAYARAGDRVSFADGYPLLLIGAASLDDLNSRLIEPVEMSRFRPSIVVSGGAPFEEDTWRSIRVGSIVCDVVKPCGRCVVTTIDPVTGISGREPLRTLGGYRRWNGHVWFGQNVIHRGIGTLAVGDAAEVLERGAPEPPLLA